MTSVVLYLVFGLLQAADAMSGVSLSIAPDGGLDINREEQALGLETDTEKLTLKLNHAAQVSHNKVMRSETKGRASQSVRQVDCDDTPITSLETTKSIHEMANQSSHSWRIRLQQPCKSGGGSHKNPIEYKQWDVYEIQLYSESCEKAEKPLVPLQSHGSGDTRVGLNPELAFDQDQETYWRGVADEGDEIWISATFSESTAVRCVKFMQCDCERSARAVTLEIDEDSKAYWVPLSTTPKVTWGEWSELEVI